MPHKTHRKQEVLLGTRIPAKLKKSLSEYCLKNGIKINYFVTEAIRDKLLVLVEDHLDGALAKERLKDAEFMSQKAFDEYLVKRGIKP